MYIVENVHRRKCTSSKMYIVESVHRRKCTSSKMYFVDQKIDSKNLHSSTFWPCALMTSSGRTWLRAGDPCICHPNFSLENFHSLFLSLLCRKSNGALHCACSKMAINEISTVLREISFFVCIMLRLHCTHMFVPLSIINR